MSEDVRFDTEIEGVWGYTAGAPPFWSYSSLKDVEACPRRWVLSRADYPDIWDRRGYPEVPHRAALLGDVIHHALEVVVRALRAHGCTDTNSSDAVEVLRGLGGLSALLRQVIDLKVSDLGSNPRVSAEARENVRHALVDQLGVASNRVQLFLSRGRLPAWPACGDGAGDESEGTGGSGSGPRRRTPVGTGPHPEVDVVAEELRLWGRIDLVTINDAGVTITDFKSGKEHPAHDDQVRLYALLWDLDRETNPERLAATELVVSYPARDRVLPAPDATALRSLEAATRTRVEHADAEVSGSSSLAKPAAEICQFCHVRHLCTEFWEEMAPSPSAVSAGDWFDLEATVIRPNGVKSWVVESTRDGVEMLVRTSSPSITLPVGKRVRVLGVRKVDEDPERPELVIAALGSSSETYVLADASA